MCFEIPIRRYDLVLLDVRRSEHASDIVIADVSDHDIEKYRDYFRGVDAIVHNVRSTQPGVRTSAPRQWLAERSGAEPVEGYFVERKSVDMAFNILRLAMEENVRRVVITSSNHAADWYETKLHNGGQPTIASFPWSCWKQILLYHFVKLLFMPILYRERFWKSFDEFQVVSRTVLLTSRFQRVRSYHI